MSEEIQELEEIVKTYTWIESFEKEFESYLKEKTKEQLNIILGQEPYKLSLNGTPFKVKNTKYPYRKLGGYVAFLVTDWIKIQDSLEMICNLLFNGTVNSLKVLAYLRENKIGADGFSNYLFCNYGIILTNIRNLTDDDKTDDDKTGDLQKDNIKNLILELGRSTNLLSVGSKSIEKCNEIKSDIGNKISIDIYECIHPSGNNLINGRDKEYYENWYNLISSNNKNLYKFSIFKYIKYK